MSNDGPTPLAGVSCFREIPEHSDGAEPSVEHEYPAGHILDGRFRIVETLSRSGMATIYRAEDLENQEEPVVVKIPLLRYESDPGFFSRFQREGQVGGSMDHPYLLRFVKPPARRSRPYLVTEFLRGCTLAHMMRDHTELPEMDALKIAALVCDGLEHMHARGVIHRDLKPSNLMVCKDRTLRIMDFGLAGPAVRKQGLLASLGSIFGTPQYMAPEQVKNGPTDERTDIYSLGVILYEMLTGRLPFDDTDPWESVNLRVTGDPAAPRSLTPGMSPQVEEIILRAMRRDPAERYQTVAEFRAVLEAPEKVVVTGLCNHLKAPRWRLSFQTTPVAVGFIISGVVVTGLVTVFLVLLHTIKAR